MKFSAWNQYWEHNEVVNLSPEQAYETLLKYYKQSSNSFILDKEIVAKSFNFQRGNILVSALGFGSELWAKHYVAVNIQEIEENKSQIVWKINLKIFGLQVGKNAIIEECKEVVNQIT